MGKSERDVSGESSPDEIAVESESIHSFSFFGQLANISKKLDSLGVESRGISRVPAYERSTNKTKQLISVIGLWLSACGGLSSMSSFFLGPLLFGLGLKKSLISGLIGSTLGCFIAAYCSLMGPRSGCRQMVSARFLFGWWTVKLVSFVSVLGVTGWSIVNSVVGGQILASMSNGKVPLYAGIIIIAGLSFFVATFGIKQLLRVEAFLAIPVNLAFLLLYVAAAGKYKYLSNEDLAGLDSATLRGNWLSFFSLAYSVTSTWGSIASDYYILFPETSPDVQIFTITLLGIFIPTTFVAVLGTLLGNIALSYEPWYAVWEEYGMGGLLVEAYSPWGGGGKFLVILLFMSLISNNILNTYSSAFGAQLAGVVFAKIPRWFWAIVATVVYLVCALVGRNKFSTILGNFLPMIGYWISMYFILLLEENVIFRTDRFIHLYTKEFPREGETSEAGKSIYDAKYASRHNKHYNFEIWNDYGKLTNGYAATVAFIVGATGAAVGMSQAYWIGPVAVLVGGDYGGDIAMWLCMGFSGITFPVLRYFELKRFGR
ncbi:vitamin B6 transporter Tpn1p [[Candida] railenensis]|uniref:Vitamin B6 transporter Tpn1p n=1 Tax=[Candida] railenensis TaxID=45579 RepID=A0A9P0QQZ6_9ASCO|nr:vitamin B6 transporter Tpn1p [[Candida] railenensis]